ncbi:hypothetical protein U1Q18_030874 [Sarracenia purpurea var. burkii]
MVAAITWEDGAPKAILLFTRNAKSFDEKVEVNMSGLSKALGIQPDKTIIKEEIIVEITEETIEADAVQGDCGHRRRTTHAVAQGVGGATMGRKGQASKGPGSGAGDDDGRNSPGWSGATEGVAQAEDERVTVPSKPCKLVVENHGNRSTETKRRKGAKTTEDVKNALQSRSIGGTDLCAEELDLCRRWTSTAESPTETKNR